MKYTKEDKEFSLKVRNRDKKCVVCGGTKNLCAHHWYWDRRYKHSKYDINNGVTLCFGCHFKLHNKATFIFLNDYLDILIKKFGWESVAKLELRGKR